MIKEAKWIMASEVQKEACYEFYRHIELKDNVKSATLSVTAMGLYTAFINGKRVGKQILTPCFTDYSSHIQYQVYDVKNMLENSFELCFICAEGWAVGRTWGREHYNTNIALIYSLDIEYYDGKKVSFLSDTKTRARTSCVLKSSIYDGETVDKTVKKRELGNAVIDSKIKTRLKKQYGEKVTEQDVLLPVKLIKTPKGENVIDFGQNLSGYVEITVNGKYGDVIQVSHAEILDKDGNFYTENLRSAKQINTYIMDGSGKESFKPLFSWQGFRYIRIDKFPDEKIDLSCFKAIAIHSDIKRTGNFVCGNKKINQLYHNIIWGQKCNFIDIPTDCPQRDERMGWTGDAQIFVKTAAINFHVEKFFEKWLKDLASDQRKDGAVPNVVPALNPDLNFTGNEGTSAAWGDAATICPWEIYLAYGNKRVLENQFPSMKKWISFILSHSTEKYLWTGGEHFGDWLGMDNGDGSFEGATPKDYIASAYVAKSTFLTIKAGRVLGEDMSEYEELYKNIVSAFKKKFTEAGVPCIDTQTAYAIALNFGLCDNRKKTAEKLNNLILNNNTKLTTGFVGTPELLNALSYNGYEKTAFDLLFQESFPSWLYSVNHGATTMWEHWDGVKEDGSFWSSEMNSYNHYAYGAVFAWMFSYIGGINTTEEAPGYKEVIIAPHADKRLGFSRMEIETKYGKLSSYWYYDEDNVHYEFEIPKGTVARISVPGMDTCIVTAGRYVYINNTY